MEHNDLIIVGGGLVGTGLFLALKRYNTRLRIALVDARLPQQNDPRLFALNMSSWQFLKNIGLAKALIPHASPIKSVHVSHRGKFGCVRLANDEVGLPALGYMVPAAQIETAMHDAMTELTPPHADARGGQASTFFTVYRPAQLCALTQAGDNLVELTIKTQNGEEKLSADYVIGADGTDSTVRQLLGIETITHDYHQSAIVTHTTLKRSHQHIAYERFTADGVIAMLPLLNDQLANISATIWTGDSDAMRALKDLSDAEFLNRLQQTFGFRLGRLQHISTRYMFPLRKVCASKMFVDRVLLLGNSAHTLHPVAAQGLNLALYEIAMLVDAIVANGGQLAVSIFKDLTTRVVSQQTISMGVSHRLTQLFSKQSLLTQTFLPLSMMALDKITPLKVAFINRMIGRNMPNFWTRSRGNR